MKDFAVEVSQKAADYLLEHFRSDPELLSKRGLAKEITTQYDIQSDNIIIEQIEKKFPAHNLLTEESGFIDKKSETTWIVDSLDGTGNFATGNPFFAVSIAVLQKEQLLLGVVNSPFLREVYTAVKGKGAFLNGNQITISKTSNFENSYLVSCEGGAKSTQLVASINAAMHPQCKDVRKLGSAALEGCWVACGRVDAYYTTDIDPWDVAAAIVIVEEAGGKITDFNGSPWESKRSHVLMSNNILHQNLLGELQKML